MRGIRLAVVFAAVVMVFVRHVHNRYKRSDYYGSAVGANSRDAGSQESYPPEADT